MGSHIVRILVSLALVAVASCDGEPRPKPSPTPTPTDNPTVEAAACHRDQIVILPRWGAAAGSYGGSWRFLNIGLAPCSFRSPATATIRNRNGKVLLESTSVRTNGPAVIVAPGGMAEAIVLWSNWCRGDAHVIRFVLPDRGGSLDVVPAGAPGCMNRSDPSLLSIESFTSLQSPKSGDSRVIAVQQAPERIAVSGEGVWIAGQERLVRLDTEGRVVWAFDLVHADGALIGGGSDVAVGEGAVWVTCSCSSEPDPRFGSTSGGVVRIDPRQNRVAAVRIFTDRVPGQVLASNGAVWVATGEGVTRLSIEDLVPQVTIRLQTDHIAAGKGRIWAVAGDEAQPFLAKIDPASNRVVSKWRLPDQPGGMVEAFGSVWVTATKSGGLLRIDPSSGETKGVDLRTASADAIAAGEGSIWVTSFADHALMRIDPRTEQVVETYDVGIDPADVAVGGGAVWVVSYSDWTVTRIPA